jgi:predicted nucleic acid-binding protein
MSEVYILDACALVAALTNEKGADVVRDVFQKAIDGEANIYMNKTNLLEVYYGIYREYGKQAADDLFNEIKNSPVIINSNLTDALFEEAGRLKASYKISLADSIALAEASVSGGLLVTSDHHEFDVIEQSDAESIKFHWIR